MQVAPLLADVTQRAPQHRRLLLQHALSALAALHTGVPSELESDQAKLNEKFSMLTNQARVPQFGAFVLAVSCKGLCVQSARCVQFWRGACNCRGSLHCKLSR